MQEEHCEVYERLWLLPLIALSGIVFLTFAAFGRSLSQDFAPIDDAFLIVDNLAVHGISLSKLRTIFTTYDPELYIPLTFLTFQLNYLVSGLDAWSYHLENLLLHAANAGLVIFLLSLLGLRRSWALFSGLLFAVHPIHTEAVAWIAGRKDVLSTFFYILCLIAYVHYRRGCRGAYLGSFAFALLASLSKAMAVTIPAILLLMDLVLERRRMNMKLVVEKIPFVVLSLLFAIIATGGKERVIGSVTAWETILMASRSTLFYIQKLFLPTELTVFYTHRGPIELGDPRFLVPLLIVGIAGITLLILSWSLWQRGLSKPYSKPFSEHSLPPISALCFGTLFFLLTLSPTFLNFQKGAETFVAVDRYAYLPSVGLLFLVLAGLQELEGKKWSQTQMVIAVLVLTLFTSQSRFQTSLWDSAEKLYTQALDVHPWSLGARISYVKLLREQGKLQEAFDLLKEGLPYGDDSHLHTAAGLILARSGRIEDAKEEFLKASAMDPLDPEPVFSLGSLLEQTENPEGAMLLYREAIALDSSYVIAHTRLAMLLLERGETAEAREQLREALDWNPNSMEAQRATAAMLDAERKATEAYEH